MHYNPHQKLKLSVSPVAIFHHKQFKTNGDSIIAINFKEYRNSVAAEYQFYSNNSIKIYGRSAL